MIVWYLDGKRVTKPESRSVMAGSMLGKLTVENQYRRPLTLRILDRGRRAEFSFRKRGEYCSTLELGTLKVGQRASVYARSHDCGMGLGCPHRSCGTLEGPVMITVEEVPLDTPTGGAGR